MRRRLLCLAGVACLAACSTAPNPNAQVVERLQGLVDSIAAEPDIPGVQLHVYSPSMALEWTGASGVGEVETGVPLTPEHTVRNASNTKTYTAAAILRLWEMGRLDLDAPIRDFLTPEQSAMLSGDGYDLTAITVRFLLAHASGLVDHGAAAEYFAAIQAAPDRRWTRDDQISGAVTWGDPLGPAGQAFSYSDTGYVLLGQVIERVTGQDLGPAVRDLLDYDRLGLAATWWELMEPVPDAAGPRAHQYVGGSDTFTWDPSIDSYGGGGLVTSSRDLAAFWYALFDGRVFEREATLDALLTTPLPPDRTPYRLGVFVREFEGLTGYTHSGFWGTSAVYVPALDLVVAGAVTEQTRARSAIEMTARAVRLIAEAQQGAAGLEIIGEGA